MQVILDPTAARRRLVALLEKHGGVVAVARELGVDRHTVQRWVSRLGLAENPGARGRPVRG
jgi:transposase-like protein